MEIKLTEELTIIFTFSQNLSITHTATAQLKHCLQRFHLFLNYLCNGSSPVYGFFNADFIGNRELHYYRFFDDCIGLPAVSRSQKMS